MLHFPIARIADVAVVMRSWVNLLFSNGVLTYGIVFSYIITEVFSGPTSYTNILNASEYVCVWGGGDRS